MVFFARLVWFEYELVYSLIVQSILLTLAYGNMPCQIQQYPQHL